MYPIFKQRHSVWGIIDGHTLAFRFTFQCKTNPGKRHAHAHWVQHTIYDARRFYTCSQRCMWNRALASQNSWQLQRHAGWQCSTLSICITRTYYTMVYNRHPCRCTHVKPADPKSRVPNNDAWNFLLAVVYGNCSLMRITTHDTIKSKGVCIKGFLRQWQYRT